jgi:nucleotide-binding universal stress UspA family protein
MKLSHILMTSDLSAESLRPCTPVATLARALGARITLLHVSEDLPIAPLAATGEVLLLPSDLQERMDSARAHLEKQRDLFPGVDVEVDVISGVDAVHAILEYAEDKDVDLIALSTHGRTGFRHLVLGSVAEKLLRHSTVPVVVFPRPAAERQVAQKSA